jgi:S-adenosyl-L-methionine hydrolase (adenosine-forming)
VPPLIALLTDFGLEDTYVGIMKGVIAGIAPTATVVDLTHGVPPQDVLAGAYALLSSYRHFPAGTVFCCVVDPEVGGDRAAVAVAAGGYAFVTPDNGMLAPILQEVAASGAVKLDDPAYHYPGGSRTFHGRDVFAPAAAHLAAGVALERVGSALDPAALQRLEWPEPTPTPDGFAATVLHVDRFGNLITSLPGSVLAGERWQVRCGSVTIRGVSPTFAAVTVGEALAYVGSAGLLELAIRQGNAARSWGAARGDAVTVTRRG